MISPFIILNNTRIDSFATLFDTLTNVGMIRSCGFFKKNEKGLDNLKNAVPVTSSSAPSSEDFSLIPMSDKLTQDKKKRGRPVEYSAFFMLHLLLTYTFTGAETLAGYFRLPISKLVGLGKTSAYDFMDNPKHNWKKLLMMISFKAYLLIQKHSNDNFSALICDDSNIHRNRAKKVELCAKNYDHVVKKNTKGFLMLPIAYSNRTTAFPCNLAVISSNNDDNVLRAARVDIDRRSVGYRRRQTATMKKTEVVVSLVRECLEMGFSAEYFMTDNWFTCNNDLVIDIVGLGLKYIGMDKNFTQKYIHEDKEYSVNELQQFAVRDLNTSNNDILGHTIIVVPPGKGRAKNMTKDQYQKACIPAKLVWLRARGDSTKILCILCTDLSLSDEEVVRNYSSRFNIEFGFFNMKHFLALESGSRARNYDSVFAHLALSCIQLIMMTLLRVYNEAPTSIGEIYYRTTQETRVQPIADVIRRIVAMVVDLPDEMIKQNFIVKGKEKEFTRAVLKKLHTVISEISLYVADFVLDIIELVKQRCQTLNNSAEVSSEKL